MTYPTLSPAWCFACSADAEETRLYAVSISRSYTDRQGRRACRTVPVKVCGPCIEGAIRASDRVRAESTMRPRGRPRVAQESRPRGRAGTAEHVNGRIPEHVRLDMLRPDQARRVLALVEELRGTRERVPKWVRLRGLDPDAARRVCELIAEARAELREVPPLSA